MFREITAIDRLNALVNEIKRYKHKADTRLRELGDNRPLIDIRKDSAIQNVLGNLLSYISEDLEYLNSQSYRVPAAEKLEEFNVLIHSEGNDTIITPYGPLGKELESGVYKVIVTKRM